MSNPDDDEVTRDYRPAPPPTGTPAQPPGWTPPQPPPGYYPGAAQHGSASPITVAKGSAVPWIVAGGVVIVVIAVAAFFLRDVVGGRTAPKSDSATVTAAPSPTVAAPAPGATGSGSTSPGTPTTSKAGVRPEQLAGLLPSAATLADLLVAESYGQVSSSNELFGDTSDRPDCGGPALPAMHESYDGSGYSGATTQEFTDRPQGDWTQSVTQSVVAFPSDEAAQAFVTTSASRWTTCKYKSVVITPVNSPNPAVYTVLNPKLDGTVLSVSTLLKQVSGFGCTHSLGARRNVVIDVQICAPGGSAQTGTLVDHIASRIPAN